MPNTVWANIDGSIISSDGMISLGEDDIRCCCGSSSSSIAYKQVCPNLENICANSIDITISGENTLTELNATWRLYQQPSHTYFYGSWFIFSPSMLIFDIILDCAYCEDNGVRWYLYVNMAVCSCGVWNEGGNTLLFGPFLLSEENCPNYITWLGGGATHEYIDDVSCREAVNKCLSEGDVSVYNCPGEANICWDMSSWTVKIKQV